MMAVASGINNLTSELANRLAATQKENVDLLLTMIGLVNDSFMPLDTCNQ